MGIGVDVNGTKQILWKSGTFENVEFKCGIMLGTEGDAWITFPNPRNRSKNSVKAPQGICTVEETHFKNTADLKGKAKGKCGKLCPQECLSKGIRPRLKPDGQLIYTYDLKIWRKSSKEKLRTIFTELEFEPLSCTGYAKQSGEKATVNQKWAVWASLCVPCCHSSVATVRHVRRGIV